MQHLAVNHPASLDLTIVQIAFSIAHGACILEAIHAVVGGSGLRDYSEQYNTAIAKHGQ